MRKELLKNISKITTGFQFRSKIEHQDNGAVAVVMAQDLKNNFYLTNTSVLTKIDYSAHTDKFIEKGDVLLSFRGYFIASVFQIQEKTMATASLYILKTDKNIILPEFLAIWLNSNQGQSQIEKNTTGSGIKTITKTALENVEIKIPSLEKQQLIIDLYKTKEELNNKLKTKVKKVDNIFQGTLTQVIK